MSRIALMPEELANQIAAGEVVERPASVVKELVENSLDASAQRIEVDLEDGGLKLIRITDDGSGMSPEDAELCLLRHATSKLRCAEDLFRLETMGFRGEALASIAAVSRLTLTTRTKDAVAAYQLRFEGSQKIAPSREVGGAVGTQLEVRDLFFNVPARLKFMKTESTEAGHIAEALIRLGLSFPGVHIKLRQRGKLTLDLPPHKSSLERSRAALSARGKGAGPPTLYLAAGSGDGMRVEAHLGAPSDTTTTPRNVFLIVNRRFVRDRSLLHAALSGYGELIERGRYPMLVMHLHLDPGTVDVNVHPQKLEVRIASPDAVYSLIRRTVQETAARAPWLLGVAQPGRVYTIGGAGGGLSTGATPLSASEAVPSYGEPAPPRIAAIGGGLEVSHARPPMAEHQLPLAAAGSGLREHRERLKKALELYAPLPTDREAEREAGTPAPPVESAAPAPAATSPAGPTSGGPAPAAGRLRLADSTYLGQLFATYLLCEQGEELLLIDQHAAHERVVYERLRKARAESSIVAQRLLFPQNVELDPKRAALVEEHRETLSTLGFELRPFGGRSFALTASPDLGAYGRGSEAQRDPEKLLGQVLDELETHGESAAVRARGELLLSTMACHAATRAGDVLDEARVRALLQSMDEVDFSPYCPHGRPVLVRLTRAELERRFGRA